MYKAHVNHLWRGFGTATSRGEEYFLNFLRNFLLSESDYDSECFLLLLSKIETRLEKWRKNHWEVYQRKNISLECLIEALTKVKTRRAELTAP